MAMRVFLIVALLAGLAGCAGVPSTHHPSLLPLAQLAPPPGRQPDLSLLARGAALTARAGALAAP